MKLQDRISLMSRLGNLMAEPDERLLAHVRRTAHHNPWFTEENQRTAMKALAEQMLRKDKLEAWAESYHLSSREGGSKENAQTIGLIFAGNIPLVGFHDWLSVFIAGHRAMLKLSERDPYLFPHLLKRLEEWDGRFAGQTQIVERLQGFDAVIATGSNNSARYFKQYFGKYPHIIRRNRNSVAVLTGEESAGDLHELGKDVFSYFGLGCRNVSKLYLPKGYVFEPLLEALHEYKELILHTPYKNNFDYNYALLMLNKEPFYATGSLILREDERLTSRIAGLHYEFYESEKHLAKALQTRRDEIQCVVSARPVEGFSVLPFGKSQSPGLKNYPDGVDVMDFLCNLAANT